MTCAWQILGTALIGVALVAPARAETEFSVYSGLQWATPSQVTGTDPGGAGSFDFLSTWEGQSLQLPPYGGARVTWWTPRNPNLGFGLDITHNKVTADDATLAASGFDRLQFTGGLTTVTANAWYRWNGRWADGRLTPYVGAGAGLSLPHVDVSSAGGTTSGYQVGGPAVSAVAGIKYDVNENWAVFGEVKGTHSVNDVTLSNGGALNTDITTGAVNVGVSFSF